MISLSLTITGISFLGSSLSSDLQKIKEDIEQRDYQDMHRDISPLKQADDAVLVDSSDMGIDEVVEAIKTVINKAK